MQWLSRFVCLNINNITIITVENVDGRCIIHNISKSVLKLWVYIKKYCLNFQSISAFLFSIYKMVDIIDIYKYLNISTGTVIKSPEMLKIISNHLKTKEFF